MKDISKRLVFIDEYRGIALITMIIYHILYDMVVIFDLDIPWFFSNEMKILQQSIGISFIFISGISCIFSKNNLKRGVYIFLIANLMTIFTAYFMPSQLILFGVLHMLGLSMCIFFFIDKLLKKIYSNKLYIILFIICILLFVFSYNIPKGFINIIEEKIILDRDFYSSSFMFWLGFPNKDFYSSDYYPLIPWFFLFMSGTFFSLLLKNKWPESFYKNRWPLLSIIGRKSLLIYTVHQPIIYLIIYIIYIIIK